jgi:hypothetical protein
MVNQCVQFFLFYKKGLTAHMHPPSGHAGIAAGTLYVACRLNGDLFPTLIRRLPCTKKSNIPGEYGED